MGQSGQLPQGEPGGQIRLDPLFRQGGGGGRPDSATAGGKDVSKLSDALEAVNDIVASMVK